MKLISQRDNGSLEMAFTSKDSSGKVSRITILREASITCLCGLLPPDPRCLYLNTAYVYAPFSVDAIPFSISRDMPTQKHDSYCP